MKVALVRKDFLPLEGGGERYAVDLAKSLRDFGHEIHVFAHRYQPLEGIFFHTIEVPVKFSSLKNWIFAKNVRLALSRNDFDIVNGLSQIYPQDIYRLGDGIHKHWLSVRPSTIFGHLWNKISLRHRVILNIEKKIFSPGNFKRIIAISNLCKQHAIKYYGVPPHLIDVIYCGVDFEVFNSSARDKGLVLRDSLGVGKGDVVVLFVGMNFARKGLRPLLRAVSQLRYKEKYRILIVGKGNIYRYKKMAQDLGLNRVAIFCGFQHNITAFYGLADVFVLPSYYEPFGNVCLEAMACGLPVITTGETGASEFVLHGRSGFVMDHPEDTAALANWLEVFEDRELSRSMGAVAQEQVLSLTIERNTKDTILVYEKALKNN